MFTTVLHCRLEWIDTHVHPPPHTHPPLTVFSCIISIFSNCPILSQYYNQSFYPLSVPTVFPRNIYVYYREHVVCVMSYHVLMYIYALLLPCGKYYIDGCNKLNFDWSTVFGWNNELVIIFTGLQLVGVHFSSIHQSQNVNDGRNFFICWHI